jgi:hypothetical protein
MFYLRIHLVSKLKKLAAKVDNGCCGLERHDCDVWYKVGIDDREVREEEAVSKEVWNLIAREH